MPTISQLQRAAANAAKRAQQAAKSALHEAERLAKAARKTAMSPTARKKLQRDLQDTVRKLGAAGKAAVVAGSAAATRETVLAALAVHGQVLVIGETDPGTGKADGVSLDLFGRLRAWCPGVCILNEADGSRMRPFKAPAAHEPVIPVETTLVVPVVGADVFGAPLDDEHVHRPELVSALSGAPLGTPITPEIVARVLAHADGGRKGVPVGARVVALINKVERLQDRAPARETAERLLREPAIHAVLLTELRGAAPVLEIYRR